MLIIHMQREKFNVYLFILKNACLNTVLPFFHAHTNMIWTLSKAHIQNISNIHKHR